MLDLLNSEQGIPTTAAYDGCYGYEMAFNDETNTFLTRNSESEKLRNFKRCDGSRHHHVR